MMSLNGDGMDGKHEFWRENFHRTKAWGFGLLFVVATLALNAGSELGFAGKDFLAKLQTPSQLWETATIRKTCMFIALQIALTFGWVIHLWDSWKKARKPTDGSDQEAVEWNQTVATRGRVWFYTISLVLTQFYIAYEIQQPDLDNKVDRILEALDKSVSSGNNVPPN